LKPLKLPPHLPLQCPLPGNSRRWSTSSCPPSQPHLQLSTLASAPAKEAARVSRHRAAMQNVRHLVRSACRIQSRWRQNRAARNVALIRMIFTEARKRHQKRPTFQKRWAEQESEKAEGSSGEPTLWKLRQSTQILQEVLLDVLGAVKVCSAVDSFITEHNERKQRREKVQARWRRHSGQLSAIGILSRQLSNARVAESTWCKLSASMEE